MGRWHDIGHDDKPHHSFTFTKTSSRRIREKNDFQPSMLITNLENDELSRGPDVCPHPHPLDLPSEDAEDEEEQEDGVDDEGPLHHPHGDPRHVLQRRRLVGVLGRRREGAGDEEGKECCNGII